MNENTKLLKTQISKYFHMRPCIGTTTKKLARKYETTTNIILKILQQLIKENQITRIQFGASFVYVYVADGNYTATQIQKVRGNIERLEPGQMNQPGVLRYAPTTTTVIRPQEL